ncbi:MAG TPA: thiamine pyrophosphate-binding protein [Candidatus Limnocylindria bacterium]|nr:thiamine pyrophosphate-binding protein [Candidatus Limnocylindria bacterium]
MPVRDRVRRPGRAPAHPARRHARLRGGAAGDREITGARRLVEALLAGGVDRIFTLSGNQILSVFDATVGRGPALIHTRHEAAAVHMADAWGRLTDRPGVALVTAGPGHLNAVSALYGALMEESPVVLLSGASPVAQRGRGAFQEIDQVAAVRPVTKAAWSATDPERIGDDVARALAIAASGCPGPVHLSLPGDVLESAATSAAAPSPITTAPAPVPAMTVKTVIAQLTEAQRPVIITGPSMGRGRRGAAVQRLAQLTRVPVMTAESPRGLNDPWLHGAAASLAEADVVLLLGKALDFSLRFGALPGFAASCRFVRIAEGASAHPRVALSIAADPEIVVEQLVAAAGGHAWHGERWAEDFARVRAATPAAWTRWRQDDAAPMHPLRVCAAVQPYLDAGAILVADGGEFGQWAQAGLDAGVRLINGPSGSIGSAIPMAIAARMAHPERTVLALLGDGTFGFHALELDTALRAGAPVVTVVGNDARWNAEYQLQLQHYGAERAVACELLPTRYDTVAQGLGAHGELVERPAQLDAALARAVASGRPACVNVLIDGVAAPTFKAGAAHS